MSLNPLTPVTDYQSMQTRIFWFTSAFALVAIWLLRSHVEVLDTWLDHVDLNLKLDDDRLVHLPASYLVPAIGVGLVARVFRVHTFLADWLGIRERFDVDVIIDELAYRTGVSLDGVPDEALVAQRFAIMRRGFYQFVGGRRPQIDELLVEQALDSWSWFWIGLDAVAMFVLTGLVLVAAGAGQVGMIVLLAALAFAAVGLPALRNECRRYAVAQVRAIASDPQRAAEVVAAFEGVLPAKPTLRRAA